MPSAAVALGLIGVSSGAAADDGNARGSGSRTGTVLRYRIDVAQIRNRRLQSTRSDARRVLKEKRTGHSGARIAGNQVRVTLPGASKMDQAVPRLRTLALPSASQLLRAGYDLTVSAAGNGLIVIEPPAGGLRSREERTRSRAAAPIQRRATPESSAAAFPHIAREKTGKRLAIVSAGKVLSAPVNRPEIRGSGASAGNFAVPEARRMALLARSRTFPASLLLAGERTIELTARRRE